MNHPKADVLMTKGAKIHRILGFMCADEKISWYDTADISRALDMKVSEVNTLVRELIANEHVKDRSTKGQVQKRSIGVCCTTATCDAYEMKEYLKDEDYLYHFYFGANGYFNLLNESYSSLKVIIDAYDEGKQSFTVHGDKTMIKNLATLKIYRSTVPIEETALKSWCDAHGELGKSSIGNYVLGYYYKPGGLKTYPDIDEEVTAKFLGNREYGNISRLRSAKGEATMSDFISKVRIDELQHIKSTKFDLTRLIRICEELNDNFSRENFIAVAALTRTLINHVPPILGFKSFKEVASSYGGPKENRSLKGNFQHLQDSMKHIGDRNAHQTVRSRETLPSEAQINFRADVDVLLEEIVRILKT